MFANVVVFLSNLDKRGYGRDGGGRGDPGVGGDGGKGLLGWRWGVVGAGYARGQAHFDI